MNATEKQVNYIKNLVKNAIAITEYDDSGYGITPRDIAQTFGIGRTFGAKMDTHKMVVDSLTARFAEWLNSLKYETKEQASATIDTLKKSTLHQDWLNDNASDIVPALTALTVKNGKVRYG